MTTADGRQVFHLAPGEAEMDKKGPDLGHRADRDSHFPVAPSVSLLEEHVGHIVAAGVDDQPLDLPYLAVGRADGQVAAYLYLAGRDVVDGDFLRGFRPVRAADGPGPERAYNAGCPNGKAAAARGVLLGGRVPGGVEIRHDLGLLGGLECLELRQAAANPQLTGCSVHKVNRNKPGRVLAALLADDEVGDLPGTRVHDDAAQLTAGSIAATGVGPDPQRHGRPPRFLGP
jgi:hypothetical protein